MTAPAGRRRSTRAAPAVRLTGVNRSAPADSRRMPCTDSRRTVSRRTALAAGSAAAASFAAGAPFVRASAKAGTKPVTVGSGDHTYEWVADWARLPDGFAWGNTHGVCQSSDGTIFVCHQTEGGPERDVVLAFDPDGEFLRSWGKEYHGGGHGLDLRVEDGTEYLYLTELRTPSTVKYALDGEKVRNWKKPEGTDQYGPDVQYMATNVAFTPDGGFFVGDGYGSSYLIKYDADGELAGVFGGPGNEPGQLRCPHGLWWDARPGREPALAVADRGNNRLSYFDLDGNFLRVEAKNTVPAPCDLDGRENLALVPDLNARVQPARRERRTRRTSGDDASNRNRPRRRPRPAQTAGEMAARQVRRPARRRLRQRRRHPRRGVGADRPADLPRTGVTQPGGLAATVRLALSHARTAEGLLVRETRESSRAPAFPGPSEGP